MDMVVFKEWLPDYPDLNNPGVTLAENVVGDMECYRPFRAFTALATTLPAVCEGMTEAIGLGGSTYIYAGTLDRLYTNTGIGAFAARSATLTTVNTYEWDFAQFDDLMIATRYGTVPLAHTVSAATNFSTLSSSDAIAITRVEHCGVINRFAVVGGYDATGNPQLQWSAIDQPRNFPTPLSATATAAQSGLQDFSVSDGRIFKIIGGDQFGLVFQENAITRVTYVGPPVVFQFDKIDSTHGLAWPTAATKVGNTTYFLGKDGFFATDGVSLNPIGAGKVDKYFINTLNQQSVVRASYDAYSKSVLWLYSSNSSVTGRAQGAMCMNTMSNKWSTLYFYGLSQTTSAEVRGIVPFSDPPPNASPASPRVQNGPFVFNANNVLGYFTDTNIYQSRIHTQDVELNPGGFAHVSGVRPLIAGISQGLTAAKVSTHVYARNDMNSSSVDVSGAISVNSRSAFADCRVEGRYHSVEVVVTGAYDKVWGLEFKAIPSGEV